MDAATLRFRANRGEMEGIDLTQLRSALMQAPLEEEAFTYAAASLAASGDMAAAERLLRIAMRRNPRSREARVLLLDLVTRRSNVREAVTQIEVLSRLLPAEQRGLLRNTLVALSSAPSTRQEALTAITQNSNKLEVLRGLARSGASASMLLDSLEAVGEIDPGEEPDSFVASLVNPLVQAGDWQGALRLWAHFNPTAFTSGELLLDPEFTGAFGPPFGWAVRPSNNGYATLGSQGLAGEFYGRRAAELASQLLVLDPGTYRLTMRSEEVGHGIRLEVACRGQGDLVDEPLEDRSQQLSFSVTEACPAPILRIVGRPTDPPRTSAFVITEIQLESLGQ